MCQVLVHKGVDRIPAGLLMKRWTREAKDGAVIQSTTDETNGYMCRETMRTVLQSAALELVNVCVDSRQTFELGLDFITRAKEAVSAITVLPGRDSSAPEIMHNTVTAAGVDAEPDLTAAEPEITDIAGAMAPERVRSRGRPKEVRMKSPIEGGEGKRKGIVTGDTDVPRVGCADEVNTGGPITRASKKTKPAKCRICASPDHFANKCPSNNVEDKTTQVRKCHRCGEEGHYRSTCGRKSTYSVTR